MKQTFFHGACSPNVMQNVREAMPSLRHGCTWTPAKMTPHDEPYFIDNGAWSAHVSGEEWDFEAFLSLLDRVEDMPREPDFVVLPDIVGDAEGTYRRSATFLRYVTKRDLSPYLAVQDGMDVEKAVRYALKLECDGIFIGGSSAWKHKVSGRFLAESHENGLKCHLARPGIENILDTIERGFDSLDTTTIARNEQYEKLRRVERMLNNGTKQQRFNA